MKHQKSKGKEMSLSGFMKAGATSILLVAGIILLQSFEVPQSIPANKTQEEKVSEPFTYVQQMPKADYKVSEFTGKNIKYPKVAKRKKQEGKVYVKFIVDEQGNITDPAIERSPHESLSKEALRVVRLMPPWKPGKQNGENVRVYIMVPVEFKLN